MEISKSIRAKIFFLFCIMGIVPLVILIIASAVNAVSELESAAKKNSLLKNDVISEHVTELIEKNQYVLHSVSLSHEIIQYLQSPTAEGLEHVTRIIYGMNSIFNDENNMALTGTDAQQIIRTDGATPVNVKRRQHFQEAMKGRPYVSDVIVSMATGRMIIVIEVPVRDSAGKPVGMLQRNFDLSALQEFIQALDDAENSIVIMDRTGRIIAHSDKIEGLGNEYSVDNRYKFILDRVYNSSGTLDVEIDGEKTLAAYSRNVLTGWMIVTLRPYHYILDLVYERAIKAVIFGAVVMILGTLLAYILTLRVTKPIVEITRAVEDVASGNIAVTKIDVSRNDELGQMAAAFNKLRSERDAYQLESELDKLTELFNKKTMENLCRMKLKTFNENEASNIFMAFYIIDLDHFKDVNDLLGHQFGDKVLIEFAKGLKKIFRPNDCIGRFGGDEFVVIVDSLPSMEVVIRKAEQIKQIAFNLAVEGKGHIVTASIGIAIAPQNGRDYDSLFASADEALYHVKNNGRNGYYSQLFEAEST